MRGCTAGRCRRSSSSRSTSLLASSAAAALALQLLLACGLLTACQAYPELFEGSECTSHPTRARGEHAAPIPDTTTTFTLSKSGSSKPETAVCPGVTYSLVLNFGGERRRALVTASSGRFGSSGSLPTNPKCPNRAASAAGSTPTYSNTLTLPCDSKGPQLLLNVTSAGKAVDHFHAASTTLPINPVSTCRDSTCPGAAAAKASPAVAAPKPAASTPAPVETAATVRAGPAQASSGSSCVASAYRYACAVDASDGATLHFTVDDSPTPPENLCTATAEAASTGSAGSSGGLPQQYLHLMFESPERGYSGVGFPQAYGKMYPADAVIGYVDSATGKPVVSAYHLTDLSPAQSATNSNGLGWASHLGAATPAGSSDRSLLCFSRPVNATQAAVAKRLDPSALQLNWVADSSTSFNKPHSLTHSMTLNAAAGTVSSSSSSAGSKLAGQLAHGALMLLAFTAFMPLGALMARHKWVLGDDTQGAIRPGWFHMHRAVQTLGLLLAVAGFILALVSFAVPWSNMGAVPTPHELYNPHRVLGVIVMAFSLLQALGGALRPGLAHKHRPNWRRGHMLVGWLTLAAGVAVVLMGAVMMHDMVGASYVSWLLPILLFLGLLLVAGAVGEVYKVKLERKGAYDPATHAFAPSGTISARSSGAGTPEAEISSRAGGPFAGDKHNAATL